ncbi:MAG: radical SAM protein [Synergistaceae bacterium]|nr:radical SAM protein [Synergistaceae bacterium]
MRALVFDGYVDEPACFGVPPYVSPYVRYSAGVLAWHGFETDYVTCDYWRANRQESDDLIAASDIVVVVMGLTVPGRYRGGSPLTLRELETIAGAKRKGTLILGGPVRSGYALRGGARAKKIAPDGVDHIALRDLEASLDLFCGSGQWDGEAARSRERLEEIAPLGAPVMARHPSFPDVIAEMELSRGCDRAGAKCSFCTEGAGGAYEERGLTSIVSEVAALDAAGVRAFRLGRCSNILAWGGDAGPSGIRPNGAEMDELYRSIRAAARNLTVLHTDNCNPLTIATFPDESLSCLEAIARHNTEGDGLSLGLESLDPAVISANSLKVTEVEALMAVRLINEAGNVRRAPDSLPKLLPGINFLFGLAGESRLGLDVNSRFLLGLLDSGLAVRRINIRRAMVFPGTALGRASAKNPPRLKERDYRRWKDWVRKEVDPVMLGRVAPDGTTLTGVIAEERVGSVMFGRALGSYPPLVGIVSKGIQVGDKLDVLVTGRGSRSLTAVRRLDPDSCGREELEALPGVGRARADFFISRRPYGRGDSKEHLQQRVKKTLDEMDCPGLAERLLRYFS